MQLKFGILQLGKVKSQYVVRYIKIIVFKGSAYINVGICYGLGIGIHSHVWEKYDKRVLSADTFFIEKNMDFPWEEEFFFSRNLHEK